MKKLILTLGIAIASYSSFAQNTPWPETGNVGIGTTSPLSGGGAASWLTLNGTSAYSGGNVYSIAGAWKGFSYVDTDGLLTQQALTGQKFVVNTYSTAMSITTAGNVGIGTTAPMAGFQLDVAGYGRFSGSSQRGIELQGGGATSYLSSYDRTNSLYLPLELGGSTFNIKTSTIAAGSTLLQVLNYATPVVTVLGSGNVGIGTTSPDEKLTVKGDIHAAEVKVDPLISIPDYVFEPDYKLTSLDELKAYVDKNHHLPEIPSAKEMEKNGIQLGDMNMKLLKKVEELTLYLIEKDNKDKNKDAQLHAQQEQINQLKEQLSSLLKP